MIAELEAFKQLVNVHESVCHVDGQAHRGCSTCESLRAPSDECREWALSQPVGRELGDIPLTEFAKQNKKGTHAT